MTSTPSFSLSKAVLTATLLGALVTPAVAETTLNVVLNSPLRALDPSVSTARITQTHGSMVFDTLLAMDEEFRPQPQMAEYTVSDDGLTYTFTLREGLLWHDGSSVTAEDCIASIVRWGDYDSAGGAMMNFVDAMEATSDSTFTISLTEPFGHLLDLLAKSAPIPAFMMPSRLAETPRGEQLTEMIGSGPFRFVADEFQPGTRAVYVRNEEYVPRDEPPSGSAGGKIVNVDRVVWHVMPDMQTAINALLSGDIDLIENVPTDLLPILEGSEDISIGVLKPVGTQITGQFNHIVPPFDDVEVRRAAMFALDQEQFLATAIGNSEFYNTCVSIYGCNVPLASDAGSEYFEGTPEERMERARELLAASSYDGTPVVILQTADIPILETQPIVAAERLREAGFAVNVVSMDGASWRARRASQEPASEGGWNMFFTTWGVEGIWDPLANVLIDGTGNPDAWPGWRVSPEVEVLRAAFITAESFEEQQQIAREIQQIAYDEGFYFNGGEYEQVSAWRVELDGIVPGMTQQFWNISKD